MLTISLILAAFAFIAIAIYLTTSSKKLTDESGKVVELDEAADVTAPIISEQDNFKELEIPVQQIPVQQLKKKRTYTKKPVAKTSVKTAGKKPVAKIIPKSVKKTTKLK